MTTQLQPAAAPHRRIRVLFLMIPMSIGGTERLVLNLAKGLDRRLFEPSIAWFEQERPLDEFTALGIPLHYVPKTRRIDFATMRQLARIVRGDRIDIINAHHFMPFFYAQYAARLANRAGIVYTEHSEADVLRATGKWRLIGQYLGNASDGVIGVSDDVTRTLASHFRLRPGRARTVTNGVDVDALEATPQKRARARALLGASPGDVLIGHVANFRRNKNHLFLLRAFHEIAASRSGARLLLFGQGYPGDPESSEADVVAYIRDNGLGDRVRLMGYRPDVQELLSGLDVSCLVSHKEGLPLSVLEAMASSLPVIGTDIPGIRGVVAPETNGLLVSPDDIAGLATALGRLTDDDHTRRRMGAASRQLAVERYALSRCIEQTEQLFLSILPGAAQRGDREGGR